MPLADEYRPRVPLRCRLGWHDWLVIEEECPHQIRQRVRDQVNGRRGPRTSLMFGPRCLERRVCRRCERREDEITPFAQAVEQKLIADKLTAARAIKLNAAEGIPPPPPLFNPSEPPFPKCLPPPRIRR